MTPIVFGESDPRHVQRPDPGRDIVVAGSDVAACLWSTAYARQCAGGMPRDMQTAARRGITIVVLRLPDAPDPPPGFFPPGTRVAAMSWDPRDGAAVIKRLHDEGPEVFPLLEPATRPEGTEA